MITKNNLLAALSRHIGKTRGVHIAELVREVARAAGLPLEEVQERRVRQLIEELRREGEHICAHPASGYYMAASAQELDDTCLFLYERAMTSLTQISAMKKVSLPDLRGQLHLPT